MNNPQKVVEMFEENIAEYTGAPYAVACDNCTNAIRMCCEYYKVDEVTIPARTYQFHNLLFRPVAALSLMTMSGSGFIS